METEIKNKLNELLSQLYDGVAVEECLTDAEIKEIGDLGYDEILQAMGNDEPTDEDHEDARKIFWAVAQNLCGETDNGWPDLADLYDRAEGKTPAKAAKDYCENTGWPQGCPQDSE